MFLHNGHAADRRLMCPHASMIRLYILRLKLHFYLLSLSCWQFVCFFFCVWCSLYRIDTTATTMVCNCKPLSTFHYALLKSNVPGAFISYTLPYLAYCQQHSIKDCSDPKPVTWAHILKNGSKGLHEETTTTWSWLQYHKPMTHFKSPLFALLRVVDPLVNYVLEGTMRRQYR